MNKFGSTLILTSVFLSNLFVSLESPATTPGIDSLRQSTIKSFLQKANNPKTSLSEKLVELNQVDGRNIDGIFPKILTAKDIQIVSIDGENLFGSYCSGLDSKPGHFKCAKGVYETYLILIPYKMGVHKATTYGKFIFMLKASRNIKWNIDNQEKEYNYQESIEISDPTPIPIDKIIPNA